MKQQYKTNKQLYSKKPELITDLTMQLRHSTQWRKQQTSEMATKQSTRRIKNIDFAQSTPNSPKEKTKLKVGIRKGSVLKT